MNLLQIIPIPIVSGNITNEEGVAMWIVFSTPFVMFVLFNLIHWIFTKHKKYNEFFDFVIFGNKFKTENYNYFGIHDFFKFFIFGFFIISNVVGILTIIIMFVSSLF